MVNDGVIQAQCSAKIWNHCPTLCCIKICLDFTFMSNKIIIVLDCDCFSDMEFLEVLTEGLNRVLLVRGGGREVITIYS